MALDVAKEEGAREGEWLRVMAGWLEDKEEKALQQKREG